MRPQQAVRHRVELLEMETWQGSAFCPCTDGQTHTAFAHAAAFCPNVHAANGICCLCLQRPAQHCTSKSVPHGSAAAAVPDMEQDSLLQTAIFTWFRLAAACPGVGHSARVPLQEMEREDAAADGRLPDNSNAEPADEEPSGAGRFSFGMNQQVSTNKLGGCGKWQM